MVLGQLRVSVIGAETLSDGVKKPYTVYRTAVNFRGQCYQRLIRFSQFHRFHTKLHLRDANAARVIVFPGKEWTRNASLMEDVVEARQVLLDEYMDCVTTFELTPGCYDRLLRLLKVGDYDVEPPRGHPAPVKTPLASMRGERSEITSGVSPEDDTLEKLERQHGIGGGVNPATAARGATDHIGGVATLVNTSVAFRSATSTAETVFTDDEQQMMTSGSSMNDDEPVLTDDDDLTDESLRESRVAASTKSPSRPPPLRASMSTPVRRGKKVKFSVQTDGLAGSNSSGSSSSEVSPERKYRSRIEKQMSNIEGMLSRYSSEIERVPSKFALKPQDVPAAAPRSRVGSL